MIRLISKSVRGENPIMEYPWLFIMG